MSVYQALTGIFLRKMAKYYGPLFWLIQIRKYYINRRIAVPYAGSGRAMEYGCPSHSIFSALYTGAFALSLVSYSPCSLSSSRT